MFSSLVLCIVLFAAGAVQRRPISMTRPTSRFSLVMLGALLGHHAIGQENASDSPPPSFDYGQVERLARTLAAQPYAADMGSLPGYLTRLSYDQYRNIGYKADKSLWREESLPFQLQFFHRGFLYKDRVTISIVDRGLVKPVSYSSKLFSFGKNKFPKDMPADMGFAGFRVHYPALLKNKPGLVEDGDFDEITVFQGASYFRAVGPGNEYGISARGLAVDTGFPRPEEFPVFKEFWVEKPDKGATTLTVYALLDSPSVTGAYRFIINAEVDLVMAVKARLFLRRGIERFGVAPLTSMFLHGENADRYFDDFRPEVHDSDGLLIGMRDGKWLWRPLANPRRVGLSVFEGGGIVGFGLMQRDRRFENYQDLVAMYHARPSGWVELIGDWGAGKVNLIEIPSDAEWHDNIVAFWVPDLPAREGQDWTFEYRLHFLLNDPPAPGDGKTLATRIGAGGAGKPGSAKRKFVVDFAGDVLRALSAEAAVDAVLSASTGTIRYPRVHKNPLNGTWRLAFEFVPDPKHDTSDLRAYLKAEDHVLTETWVNRWSKP